jgi:hypothetical protein
MIIINLNFIKDKMKKIFFLMLTFIVLSAASVNAQVTIGSTDDPHSGAILDLQSTTQGLKLPTVSITNLTTFGLPLEGASIAAGAKGMVVYNTNAATGIGLLVWSGYRWNSIIPCLKAPGAPGTITFSAFSVNPGATFTVSFPAVAGAISYSWTLPAGLSAPSLTTTVPTIKITGKDAGTYDGSDIKVVAVNTCGSSVARAGSGSIWVTDCTITPAIPGTISFNYPNIDLGDSIIASVDTVANATSYIWTLPTGLSASSLTTTVPRLNIIGGTADSYNPANITVAAKNCTNTSAPRAGTGDDIVVAVNPKLGTVSGATGIVYATYDVGPLGTFMIDNSREPGFTYDRYPGMTAGERGYYYTVDSIVDNVTCPPNWRIPTIDEIIALNSLPLSERQRYLSPQRTLGGGWSVSGDEWLNWDTMDNIVAYPLDNEKWTDARVTTSGSWSTAGFVSLHLGAVRQVRCINP